MSNKKNILHNAYFNMLEDEYTRNHNEVGRCLPLICRIIRYITAANAD